MNWDALGAMGEIAGAIAVIATLFFSHVSYRLIHVNWKEIMSIKGQHLLPMEMTYSIRPCAR